MTNEANPRLFLQFLNNFHHLIFSQRYYIHKASFRCELLFLFHSLRYETKRTVILIAIFSHLQKLIHLCDVLYFGALAPCPVCKNGKFVFRNSAYCCTGYVSAWSSCTHTVREPQRIPVEIPEKYKETLGTDFEVRTRILRDVTKFNEDEFE